MYVNVLTVISIISFTKSVISTFSTKAKFRENKAAKLQQSKWFLPTKSILILDTANWFDFLVFKWSGVFSMMLYPKIDNQIESERHRHICLYQRSNKYTLVWKYVSNNTHGSNLCIYRFQAAESRKGILTLGLLNCIRDKGLWLFGKWFLYVNCAMHYC